MQTILTMTRKKEKTFGRYVVVVVHDEIKDLLPRKMVMVDSSMSFQPAEYCFVYFSIYCKCTLNNERILSFIFYMFMCSLEFSLHVESNLKYQLLIQLSEMNGVECIRKEDKQDTSHHAIHKFHSVWKPQMERKLICVITRLRSKLRSLEVVFDTVF